MALSREWIELGRSIPPLPKIAMRIGVAQGKQKDRHSDEAAVHQIFAADRYGFRSGLLRCTKGRIK
ncbi:hypothetical protein [Rhizobium viscosum]|uniref:Transposase n=1 Tax=Rhizobium viscosum TaxID=1673 RepID=A0ABR9J350_RHIVS|nr:hypothetical protein [Rhizobium viscosum]MBE1509482.1 hypothetical protein [Rhizobium viscosum]